MIPSYKKECEQRDSHESEYRDLIWGPDMRICDQSNTECASQEEIDNERVVRGGRNRILSYKLQQQHKFLESLKLRAEIWEKEQCEKLQKTPPTKQSSTLKQKLWKGCQTAGSVVFRWRNPAWYTRSLVKIYKSVKRTSTKR